MKCERCGADCQAERLTVDGFTGHLCESCYEQCEEYLAHG